MNHHKRFLAVVGFLLVVGSLGFGQAVPSNTNRQTGATMSAQTGSMSSSDRSFVQKAAQGGMAEVEFGQLAQENAQSQDVKDFGKRMVDDHSKAGDQLKQVASQQGVTLPTDLSAQDNATKQRLSKLHGDAFDRAYMKDMVTDHRQDVAEFKHESTAGRDPQVKQWATETLPTLEEHLKMAEQVDAKIGGTRTGQTPSSPSKQPEH